MLSQTASPPLNPASASAPAPAPPAPTVSAPAVDSLTAVEIAQPLVILALAAVLVVWLIRSGRLTRRALADRPERRVGLTPVDAVAGVMLFFGGQLVAAGLVRDQGLPLVAQVLTGQVLGMGPACAWFWIRSATAGAFLGPETGDGAPPSIGSAARRGLVDAGVLPRDLPAETRSGLAGAGAGLVLSSGLLGTLVLITTLISGEPPGNNHGLLDSFINLDGFALAGLLLSTIVFAPLFEETLFRGLFQTSILGGIGWSATKRWCVIVGVALAFSAIHIDGVSWQALVPLAVLGVLFGWLYERSGSLWPSLIAHALFNALNVVMHIAFTAYGGA